MYCKKCGKEIDDDAVVCIGCGCLTVNKESFASKPDPSSESKLLANHALWWAFLIPPIGLICGIIGICTYETKNYWKRCLLAIIFSIVCWSWAAFVLWHAF